MRLLVIDNLFILWMHNIIMNNLIDINKIINGIDLEKDYSSQDHRLDKAIKLIMAAAKMAADSANLLHSYASDTMNPTIKLYAMLASEVANEASTLAAAASSLCNECIEA